jgi:hypothetical protein
MKPGSIGSIILFLFAINSNRGYCQKFNTPLMIGHNFADSIIKSGADTILFGVYNYDNGFTFQKQFVYWEKNHLHQIKIFEIDSTFIPKTAPAKQIDLSQEINYCLAKHIDTMKMPIKIKNRRSQDLCYIITVLMHGKSFYFTVRDNERKQNTSDPRCKVVNQLDKKLENLDEWNISKQGR